MTDATTISVNGDASYDITVGRGILSTLDVEQLITTLGESA